jgi:Ran GTPase-activating protein (RanGAP) involved in mRNA processing and transport
VLDVRDNRLDAIGAAILATGRWCQLRRLRLEGNELEQAEQAAREVLAELQRRAGG